jgi:hypothetical protein
MAIAVHFLRLAGPAQVVEDVDLRRYRRPKESGEGFEIISVSGP